ncbi:MAG: hypothetical protein WA949_07285 [Phormidesmis sp.]
MTGIEDTVSVKVGKGASRAIKIARNSAASDELIWRCQTGSKVWQKSSKCPAVLFDSVDNLTQLVALIT